MNTNQFILNHKWDQYLPESKSTSRQENLQVQRMRKQIFGQRIIRHNPKSFLKNMISGLSVPILTLTYPLLFVKDLDYSWSYLVFILLINLVGLFATLGNVDNKAERRVDIDNLYGEEFSPYWKFINMFASGWLLVVGAIILGYIIPSVFFDVSNIFPMLTVTMIGTGMLTHYAWKMSMREILPQMEELSCLR